MPQFQAKAPETPCVCRSQPGDDFTSQSPRAKDNTVVLHCHRQVMNRDLPVNGCARSCQKWALIVAQKRPVNNIPDASFWQMCHLGKDYIFPGADCFLSPQVLMHPDRKFAIRMTEPAQ